MLPDNTELPKANVLRYDLSDGKTYFIVRPSGTEPKIKIYLGSNAETFDAAMATVDAVLADVSAQLGL
jgi:phosphomannomutase